MPDSEPPVSEPRSRNYIYLALLAIVIALTPRILRSATTSGLLGLPTKIRTLTAPSTQFPPEMSKSADCPVEKLSPREEKEWNFLADTMDRFHTHFRWEFNRMYELADGGFHKEGMSLPRFLREAAQLSQHLDMHHRIEAYWFPALGKKLPQFKAGAREKGEHLKSHKAIHDGLEKYDAFLREASESSANYNPDKFRAILDSFREVLFRHLDEEVADLQGSNLRKAGFTMKELRQIAM